MSSASKFRVNCEGKEQLKINICVFDLIKNLSLESSNIILVTSEKLLLPSVLNVQF